MIERKFVGDQIKNYRVEEFIMKSLSKSGISKTKLQVTPLGEKIIVCTSRPGIVVGKGGQHIQKLTTGLKKGFKLGNPQIEISEVEQPSLNARIMADKIALNMERYGARNFKGLMHRSIADIISCGAAGVEIVIKGKVPSARARSWRVLKGYMKKCGDIAIEKIDKATSIARLKSGVVGVTVSIMPSNVQLPDSVKMLDDETKSNKTTDDGETGEASPDADNKSVIDEDLTKISAKEESGKEENVEEKIEEDKEGLNVAKADIKSSKKKSPKKTSKKKSKPSIKSSIKEKLVEKSVENTELPPDDVNVKTTSSESPSKVNDKEGDAEEQEHQQKADSNNSHLTTLSDDNTKDEEVVEQGGKETLKETLNK